MSLPLTINTIPAEHGSVEHQLVDAVGWIHARIWNRSDADAAAVKAVLEGRPAEIPTFDVPAMLDPPSPDLAGDQYAEGYVAAWNACVQRMAAGAGGIVTIRSVPGENRIEIEASLVMPAPSTKEILDAIKSTIAMRAATSSVIMPATGMASLAAEVIALAEERTAGYAARENGNVLNGRVADKLVELVEHLRRGLPQLERVNPREQAVDRVRCILLSIASCSRDDAAVADAKRALDILDGRSAAQPQHSTPFDDAAVRALVGEWNAEAWKLERAGVNTPNYDKGEAAAFRQCADNLSAALTAAGCAGPKWVSPFEPCVCEGQNQCPGCNPDEAIKLAREIAIGDERRKHAPCMECGAKTAKEAETMCICSGDKDDCHGCSLWPDGDAAQPAAGVPEGTPMMPITRILIAIVVVTVVSLVAVFLKFGSGVGGVHG